MKYDVNAINSYPILEVASALGLDAKKKGVVYKALCVWHDDHTPSMQIGGRRNICYCYSCGNGGNVIDLVMAARNTDFLGACEWMADRFPEGDFIVNEVATKKRKKNSLRELEMFLRSARAKPEEKPFMVLALDEVKSRMRFDDSFFRCMEKVFGKEVATKVALKYMLGSIPAREGYPNVIFPLIDRWQQVRGMKVQGYHCTRHTDRFFHKTNTCYWLESLLCPNETFNRNCLFGEHLLARNPDKLVVLVESPKNACIGAAAYPEYTWVAAGNKNMLKREVLEPLRGRNVIVYPDADAYEEWSQILSTMKDIAPFNVLQVPNASGKEDIADWILRKLKS